jgi:hypothetical protein
MPTKTKGSRLVSVRAGVPIDVPLQQRGPEPQWGSVAKRDLLRYYSLLASHIDALTRSHFTREEWEMLAVLAKPIIIEPPTNIGHVEHIVAMLRLNEADDPDWQQLADKLEELSPCQRQAVQDWLEREWIRNGGAYA